MSAFVEDTSVLTRRANEPDALLRYGDEANQIADVRYGDASCETKPLLILVHGGFWRPIYDRAHTRPMAAALAAAGWTVAIPEYRRIPCEPDATTTDVLTACRTLPQKIDRHNGEIILIGHSAGGHLVLWTASQAKLAIKRCVALAPAADLQSAHDLNLGDGAVKLFLGVPPRERPDLDPNRLPNGVETIIVHGEDDAIVPMTVSESYVATHPDTSLVRVKDCGHFAVIDPQSNAWFEVIKAVKSP